MFRLLFFCGARPVAGLRFEKKKHGAGGPRRILQLSNLHVKWHRRKGLTLKYKDTEEKPVPGRAI